MACRYRGDRCGCPGPAGGQNQSGPMSSSPSGESERLGVHDWRYCPGSSTWRGVAGRIIRPSGGGNPGSGSDCRGRRRRDTPTGCRERRGSNRPPDGPEGARRRALGICDTASRVLPVAVLYPLPRVPQHVVQPEIIRSLPPPPDGSRTTLTGTAFPSSPNNRPRRRTSPRCCRRTTRSCPTSARC